MTPTTTDAPTRVGRIARWKLTEPVRLYVYGWSLLLLVAACLTAAVSGFWQGPATVLLVTLLGIPAVECARASVFSPRTMVRTMLEARTR
jgi:hypothetical protein